MSCSKNLSDIKEKHQLSIGIKIMLDIYTDMDWLVC